MTSEQTLLLDGLKNRIEAVFELPEEQYIEDYDIEIGHDMQTIGNSLDVIIDNNLGTIEDITTVVDFIENDENSEVSSLCAILAQTDLGIPLDIAANIVSQGEIFSDVTTDEKQEVINNVFEKEINLDRYEKNPINFVAGSFAEESDYIDFDNIYDMVSDLGNVITSNGELPINSPIGLTNLDIILWNADAPQDIIDFVIESDLVHLYQAEELVDGFEGGLSIDELRMYADSGLYSDVMGEIKNVLLGGEYEYTLIKEVYDEIKDDENKNVKLEMAATAISGVYSNTEGSDIGVEIKNDKAEILANIDKAIEYQSNILEELDVSLFPEEAMSIVGVYELSDNEEIKEYIKEWNQDDDRSDKINNAGAILNAIESGTMTKEDIGNDVKSFVDNHNNDMNIVGMSATTQTALICEIVKDENQLEKIKDFVLDKYNESLIPDKADYLKESISDFLKLEDDENTTNDKLETIKNVIESAPAMYEVKNLVDNGVDVGNLGNADSENKLEIAEEIKEMITDEYGDIDPDKVDYFNETLGLGADFVNDKIGEEKNTISTPDFDDFQGATEDNKESIEQETDEKVDNELVSSDEDNKVDNSENETDKGLDKNEEDIEQDSVIDDDEE